MQSLPVDDLSEPLDWETMAVTEKRVHSIESELSRIAQRLATLEGHKEASSAPHKSPNAALITVLSILGIAVIWYWGWIGTQVVDHGKKLTEIYALLLPQRLAQAAATATSKESISVATQTLATATGKGIQIPPAVVKEAGDKFVNASKETPQAWDVVLQLAKYRTALNVDALPPLPHMRPVDPRTYPAFLYIWPDKEAERPTEQDPKMSLNGIPATTWLVGDAPPEAAAKVEPLKNPNKVSSEAQFIIFDWTRKDIHVVLDGMHLKNIIVKNAKIYYRGGPILLENVYFVNCTFEGVSQQPSGQDFAKALFDAASMTFRVG